MKENCADCDRHKCTNMCLTSVRLCDGKCRRKHRKCSLRACSTHFEPVKSWGILEALEGE